MSVAFGGIVDWPRSPYASSGGIVSFALPPTFIIASPSLQPGTTRSSGNSTASPRASDE